MKRVLLNNVFYNAFVVNGNVKSQEEDLKTIEWPQKRVRLLRFRQDLKTNEIRLLFEKIFQKHLRLRNAAID